MITEDQRKKVVEWVKALRGGTYKQAREFLKNDVGFCCLGVACDLSGLSEWEHIEYVDPAGPGQKAITYLGSKSYIPALVSRMFGLSIENEAGVWETNDDLIHRLIHLNDGDEDTEPVGFDKIADVIEAELVHATAE